MSEEKVAIHVTKTYLPPLEEYIRLLEGVWERNQVTNNGPLVKELEDKLKEYLGVKHLFFVNNGTIALQIAIKALDLHGEIITTPFSYVATTSSIVWEGCQPVFVDIEPETLNLNAELIEAAISPRTSAILPVHVYGYPCDVRRIESIAVHYGLKVIYDAAHAFGVQYKQRSLLTYGDISIVSFHATKLFHTVEGGALVTNDDELAHRIAFMRNFGHKSPHEFWDVGINGKNSEFHAAMGLCLLPKVSQHMTQRQAISHRYDQELCGIGLERPILGESVRYNFAYYPVLFPSREILEAACAVLNEAQIFPRRYFLPSLNKLDYVPYRATPVAEDVASRVLCLPLYADLTSSQVAKISSLIRSVVSK